MLIRIKELKTLPNYILAIEFDDGKMVLYDVKEDMNDIASYRDLMHINGLFEQAMLDESRTCVVWNENIDLPSDILYEYGKPIGTADMGEEDYTKENYSKTDYSFDEIEDLMKVSDQTIDVEEQ